MLLLKLPLIVLVSSLVSLVLLRLVAYIRGDEL